MNDTRARFEEIWPVPDGIEWLSNVGRYVQITGKWLPMGAAQAYNARLDTFTRCQDTMAPVFSLIEEMISEFEADQIWYPWLDRAKQIMEQKK